MELHKIYTSKDLDLYSISAETELSLPKVLEKIVAGFPSPAQDFMDDPINLNRYLVRNKSATFCGEAKGDSLKGIGISAGDLLIFDRSLEPKDGKVAICSIDGELTMKMLKIEKDCVWLMPANDKFKPIKVTQDNNLVVLGMLTFTIKSFWWNDSVG